MAKKVIRLTESEFINHIRRVVNEAMNEMDGKTHARVSNAVKKAKDLNQQNVFTTAVKNRPNNPIVHDDVIARGKGTEQRANKALLSPFIDTTFMFYATTRLGRTTFLTFKVQDIKKLMDGIAILSGEVVYDGEMLTGDIHIDFNRERVFYKEKKSRYTYTLEPDNRTIKQWNALLEQLKMSLDNRI
mgnify:FL=1